MSESLVLYACLLLVCASLYVMLVGLTFREAGKRMRKANLAFMHGDRDLGKKLMREAEILMDRANRMRFWV